MLPRVHAIDPAADSRSERVMTKARSGWLWILGAGVVAWPWLLFRFLGDYHHAPPVLVAALSGVAILGAAFLLSWAAEAFQMDVSQALALALLSLIAVLPEYAVDVVFAWRAATDPTQAPYAVANMTGANRLLIGLGWSLVVLVAWWRTRSRAAVSHSVSTGHGVIVNGAVQLAPGQALEIAALGAATLYSFIIPLKGGIGLIDTVLLVSLFAVYAWATARAPAEEPELVGPAMTIGTMAKTPRRITTYGLFIYAAAVIFASAEPFAHGLVLTGTTLGINEFLLVQWLAPLASEAPEFVVALLFAWRGMAGAGLRTLVASKVNQWTLLIGTLGLAYSIALGRPADLPIDMRQAEELLLTSAQSLFALALIANFNLSVRESVVLLSTFMLQLFFPTTEVRLAFAGVYILTGVGLIALTADRRRTLFALPAMIQAAITPPGLSTSPDEPDSAKGPASSTGYEHA
jgi:cation:H+ antiporter